MSRIWPLVRDCLSDAAGITDRISFFLVICIIIFTFNAYSFTSHHYLQMTSKRESNAKVTNNDTLGNLWLYWSATFVGTSIVAFILKGKFVENRG